jgi:hypothetical protein
MQFIDGMPIIDGNVLIGIITALGGGFLKLLWDNRKSLKLQKALLRVTQEKARHDTYISRLRIEREEAIDIREQAYDEYDEASKSLLMLTAKSYLAGNDKKQLQNGIDTMENAKKEFKAASQKYHTKVSAIVDKMMRGPDKELNEKVS